MPATSTDRIDGLTTSVAVKAPCRVATTANITLSGLQTVGGVVLAAGDRVLVKDQTTTTGNGIYVASSTAWSRARDFNGARDAVNGTRVLVGTSTVYALNCTNPVTFGTTALTFTLVGIGAGTNVVSVRDFGAVGDGVTDDASAIQSALSSFGSGGGGVYFPAGSYKVGSTITLKTRVKMWAQHGVTLTWSGGASAMFTSSTTTTLEEAAISGMKIDCGAATKCLELYSAFRCAFSDLTLASSSSTNFIIDILCNSTGGTNPDANRNGVYNSFDNILQTGTCGTFIRMRGNGLDQVVTLNTFHSVNSQSCAVRGVDFSRWADSNTFSGMTKLKIDGSGGIGVEFNSDAPTVDNGVYANSFQHLAVDTFSSGLGRYGIKLNACKQCVISMYYNDPEAENGALTATSYTYGYDINLQRAGVAGANFTYRRMQGVGLMLGGSVNASYVINTTSFTMRGVNQASIVVADTYNSEAAGTSCSGITLSPSLQATAWTLGTYYGVNVQNVAKGAGSAATNQVGVYVADLTSGVNNFGIQHDVSFGANKYGIYANGTAVNLLRGGLYTGAGSTIATDGFVNIPACAGPPAGAPTKYTGTVPLCYDYVNNRLYVYSSTAGTTVGAAWRSALTT